MKIIMYNSAATQFTIGIAPMKIFIAVTETEKQSFLFGLKRKKVSSSNNAIPTNVNK
jgi:hypothetical protein